MRSIKKVSENECCKKLRDRLKKHQKEVAENKHSPKAWKNFRKRECTRTICLYEQFGLCAYSEVLLDDDERGMHFDHVEAKSNKPERTFEHTNLLLSAFRDGGLRVKNDDVDGDIAFESDQVNDGEHATQAQTDDICMHRNKHDVFGGHARIMHDANDFIHPLWHLQNRGDVRKYFHYGANGRVEPALDLAEADKAKVLDTITHLNLNSNVLVNLRRHRLQALDEAINVILEMLDELDELDELDASAKLDELARRELGVTGGKMLEFHSAVMQRFEKRGERIMQQQHPQCLCENFNDLNLVDANACQCQCHPRFKRAI